MVRTTYVAKMESDHWTWNMHIHLPNTGPRSFHEDMCDKKTISAARVEENIDQGTHTKP